MVPTAGSDTADSEAFQLWINQLLNGEKLFAYGGTDYHEENVLPLSVINYAYLDSFDVDGLKTALSSGKNTVSNNGLAYIELRTQYDNDWNMQGSTVSICNGENVDVKATYNVPYSCDLKIYKGDIGYNEYSFSYDGVAGSSSKTVTDYPITRDSYFRAQCVNEGTNRRVYTNPIFVEIDDSQSDADGICDSGDNIKIDFKEMRM